MWFIHKLWFDTHISPQEDPQDLQSTQGHPQICPQGGLATIRHQEEPDNALPVLSPHRLQVLDSRTTIWGIRRRRQCPSCERRFTTIEQMQLVVGTQEHEPFNRDKVINGVRKACKGGRSGGPARLGQLVEDSLRTLGQPEIPADEVGVAILGRCASWTKSPTCASQVSIASSDRWRTLRRRLRCCVWSRSPQGLSRSSQIARRTTR